jgi:hypothetical protein
VGTLKMKTLIRQEDTVSLYIFDDATEVSVEGTQVVVGNPVEIYITFCNDINSMLINNVTPPADWNPSKYCFNGIDWTINPNYVEPTLEQE